MARMPRVEFEGAAYHVVCSGNRREAIFRCDEDRERVVETLAEGCERTGWRFMPQRSADGNHYHLLLETPEPNLVRQRHWFQVPYTTRFQVLPGLEWVPMHARSGKR